MPSYIEQAAGLKFLVNDERKFRQRRGQIIAAAVQLFAEKGYHKTRVQDIAVRVGISAGLIYQYVQDKETLLLLSILDVLDSYATELPLAVRGIDDPLERCCAAFRAYCKVVDERREATVLAYVSTKSLPPKQRQFIKNAERDTNQMIASYIQTCIDQGVFRPVDCELATYQLVMYAHAWALKHWQLKNRFDLETYVAQGLDLFLHAMLMDNDRLLQRGRPT
ncbi:MAG TPA: TetR/AcrR family transcriptional regulator [Xanthomonadales bacterium]|nr:TetR/AcrR family transcriptional regulator [Xanthomonadales bacterium]